MAIGERIKQARQMRGLSMRDLAHEIGVSAQSVSNYERGVNTPDSSMLLCLAQSLGVGAEFFIRPPRVMELTPACDCSAPGRS
jgi:transcriptional regulator with XRE-family HTH domain